MKISKNRILIYIAFFTLLSLTGGFFYWITSDLRNASKQSAKINSAMELMSHLDKLNTSIGNVERNEKPYLITKNTQRIVQIKSGYAIAAQELESLKKLCDNYFFYCDDMLQLDSILQKKVRLSNRIIDLSMHHKPDSAIALFVQPADSLINAGFINKYNAIYEHAKENIDKVVADHAALSVSMYNLIVWVIFLSMLFFFYIFLRLSANISKTGKLISQNQLFADIINSSLESVVVTDAKQHIIFSNPATEKLYERNKDEIQGGVTDNVFETDNTDNVIECRNNALLAEGRWSGEIKGKDSEGNVLELYQNVNSFKNKAGIVTAFFSITTNITELKRSQHKVEELVERLRESNFTLHQKVDEQTAIIREVFERVQDAFIGTDKNLNITYANQHASDLFGFPQVWIIGKSISGFLLAIADEENCRLLNECLVRQEKRMFEFIHPHSGNCFQVNLYPSENGISLYFRDISQAKRDREEISRSQRMYRFISKANDIILNAKDEKEIFSNICDTAIGSGGFVFAWIGIPDPYTRIVKPVNWSGNEEGYLGVIGSISTKDLPSGRAPTGRALREGKMYYCNDIENDPAMVIWRDEALKRGYRSSIALPVKVMGEVVAIYTLYASKANYFSPEEIQLLVRVTENLEYAQTAFQLNREKKKMEDQLQKVLQAIEQSSASVVISNLNGDIEYVNPAFTKLTGYSYEEVIGQNPRILKTGYTTEEEYRTIWQNLTGKKEWQGEFCNKKKNGELYWEYAVISPVIGKNGDITNYIAVKENITERKIMQENQRELVAIIENTSAFIGRANMNKGFDYINRAFREVLDLGEYEDLSGLSIVDFSAKGLTNTDERFESLIRTGKWVGENIFISKKGRKTPVLQTVIIHKDAQGQPMHILSTAIDLTAIKEKEEQLILLNKEMTDLARHLQSISEIEKKEIAREIHDELGQYLTAIKMEIAWIRKHTDGNRSVMETKLDGIQEVVTETIASFKRIHSSLHPAMLEDVGLYAAVEWYIGSVEKFSQVPINLVSNMQKMKINFAVSLPLYRVIQECVTNIVRYSKATAASVILERSSSHIYVKIKDNGTGFVVAEVDTKQHHGILGMKERVYAINGQISIHSVIGEGTLVNVRVPVNTVD